MSGITHSQLPVREALRRDQRHAKMLALVAVNVTAALLVAVALALGDGDSRTAAARQPAIHVVEHPPISELATRYDGGPGR